MEEVTIYDKTFERAIGYAEIVVAIESLARQVNRDYPMGAKPPVFICVLNGAFMFAAELLKNIGFAAEVSFVKISSYDGTGSTGNAVRLMGLSEDISGRDVIVLEDIVETGGTVKILNEMIAPHNPASIAFASLFFKRGIYRGDIKINYHAMEIPDDFIVGFGLDYRGLGRNLRNVYKLKV